MNRTLKNHKWQRAALKTTLAGAIAVTFSAVSSNARSQYCNLDEMYQECWNAYSYHVHECSQPMVNNCEANYIACGGADHCEQERAECISTATSACEEIYKDTLVDCVAGVMNDYYLYCC
jgi:hypothetical protein